MNQLEFEFNKEQGKHNYENLFLKRSTTNNRKLNRNELGNITSLSHSRCNTNNSHVMNRISNREYNDLIENII